MSEATQTYFTVGSGTEDTDNGFYSALDYIRENANTQYGKGRLFERLVRTYLLEDPFYKSGFPKSISGRNGQNSDQNSMVLI